MRIFVLLFLLVSLQGIQAQSMAGHNLYPYNPNFANPAATGTASCLEVAVTDQHQWAGFTNAPNIQSFSVQKGLSFARDKKNGLGMNLVRDSNGPAKSLMGELLYSLHAILGRNRLTWLSLGLSGQIEQRRLDEGGFSPVFDPTVTGGVEEEFAYNASAGVYLYHDQYFAGLAVYNLLPVNNTLGLGYGGDRFYLSIQGGYLFTFSRSPVTLLTSLQTGIGQSVYQIDANTRLKLKNKIWAGLTLRKYLGEFETAGQNMLVFLGYDWNSWSLGYNYNFDINGTQFNHYGTHQFAIGYRICRDENSCPAYR